MSNANWNRLKIIEQTPYLITDEVLLKDFKWLIEQARRGQLMEQYRFESELHKDLYEKVLAANKILGEALVIAYSHCEGNLMDETIDVIRMALDGEEVGELWADDLKKGIGYLEESYK